MEGAIAETTTLYVGNLSREVTEGDLRAAFTRFGEVVSVKIMADRRGRPKGFALIKLPSESAATALEQLQGTQLRGRTMDLAEETAQRGGGGRRARRR